MRRARRTLLLAAALLTGCASTSESYIEEQIGYAVTRGRIIRFENLQSEEIEPLADGVAMVASGSGRVSVRFEDGRTQAVQIAPGMIVVFAAERDYVLRSERRDGR